MSGRAPPHTVEINISKQGGGKNKEGRRIRRFTTLSVYRFSLIPCYNIKPEARKRMLNVNPNPHQKRDLLLAKVHENVHSRVEVLFGKYPGISVKFRLFIFFFIH